MLPSIGRTKLPLMPQQTAHTPFPLIPEHESKSVSCLHRNTVNYVPHESDTFIKPLQSPHYSFSLLSSNKSWPHMTCRPLLIGIQLPCWHRPASHLAHSLPAGKAAEGIIQRSLTLSLICYYYTHASCLKGSERTHCIHKLMCTHRHHVTSGSVHKQPNINFLLLS